MIAAKISLGKLQEDLTHYFNCVQGGDAFHVTYNGRDLLLKPYEDDPALSEICPFSRSINALPVDLVTINTLRKHAPEIRHIGDLVQTNEKKLLARHFFGKGRVDEIKAGLAKLRPGLTLGMTLTDWPSSGPLEDNNLRFLPISQVRALGSQWVMSNLPLAFKLGRQTIAILEDSPHTFEN